MQADMIYFAIKNANRLCNNLGSTCIGGIPKNRITTRVLPTFQRKKTQKFFYKKIENYKS